MNDKPIRGLFRNDFPHAQQLHECAEKYIQERVLTAIKNKDIKFFDKSTYLRDVAITALIFSLTIKFNVDQRTACDIMARAWNEERMDCAFSARDVERIAEQNQKLLTEFRAIALTSQ